MPCPMSWWSTTFAEATCSLDLKKRDAPRPVDLPTPETYREVTANQFGCMKQA